MNESHNLNISIHTSCPIEIKHIIEKNFKEYPSNFTDIHKNLFADERTAQLWKYLNRIECNEEKEKATREIINLIPFFYRECLQLEIYFKNKDELAKIEQDMKEYSEKMTYMITRLNQLQLTSNEDKEKMTKILNLEDLNYYFKRALHPPELYGTIISKNFEGITLLTKTSQENASEIVFTLMLAVLFKEKLNISLHSLVGDIPSIIKKIPSNKDEEGTRRSRVQKNVTRFLKGKNFLK